MQLINIDTFIDNETIADDEKLVLFQSVLRRVDKYKPYHERPLKVIVIDHIKHQNSPLPPKQEKEH